MQSSLQVTCSKILPHGLSFSRLDSFAVIKFIWYLLCDKIVSHDIQPLLVSIL